MAGPQITLSVSLPKPADVITDLRQGPTGPAGPASPKATLASTVGIAPGNTGEQNSNAFDAWRDNASVFAHDLVFDASSPGQTTYSFSRPLQIPVWRRIRGAAHGITLKYTGPAARGAGTAFVTAFNGTPIFVEDLILSVRDGSTESGLLDYVVEAHGTLSPNVSGATIYARRVYAQFGDRACFRGLNNSMLLFDVQTFGGPRGVLFEGCSESVIRGGYMFGHSVAGIVNRGLYSPGGGFTNGGKLTATEIVIGKQPTVDLVDGVDLDGVANCSIYGITAEGPSGAAYRIRNGSTNIHIHGSRSNGAGPHVVFDAAVFCRVVGGCSSLQASAGARYLNNARNCRADLAVENNTGHVDVVQRFGALEWQAWIRRDGIISVGQNQPTDGYWEIGDEVRPRVAVSGQPMGWRCTANGNPGTWKALANVP